MSTRRWQNFAKYLYDVSKVIIAIAVVGQFVTGTPINWKMIAFGVIGGVLFLVAAMGADKKGELV